MDTYTVYSLRDPATEEVFYVGCTTNLYQRYASHTARKSEPVTKKDKWIKTLIEKGEMPLIKTECICSTAEEAAQKEVAYFDMYNKGQMLSASPKFHPYNMAGRNPRKEDLNGKWLKESLAAQGVTVYSVAKQLGYSPDKFYRHIRGQTFLSSESLAELARLYPTMNMRYVLTGQGSPLSSNSTTDATAG